MRIVPYRSFGDLQLGDSEEAVTKQLGPPGRRAVHDIGEIELSYEPIVVRVLLPIGVVEITARPEEVQIGEQCVSRQELPEHLKRIDPQASEIHGFMVSRLYGVAVDTDTVNDGWITVFSEGRWDEFMADA